MNKVLRGCLPYFVLLFIFVLLVFLLALLFRASEEEDVARMTGLVSRLAVGNSTVLAVQPCGALWTWGMVVGRHYAQGTILFERILPAERVAVDGAVVYVSTAGRGNMSFARNHAMALTADGRLWGWGADDRGQLGDGTRQFRTDPIPIKAGVVAVATGSMVTMAIDAHGVLWGCAY